MRSKIHKATVVEADLDYIGSITIDADLIDRAGLWPGEKVLVVSNTSGWKHTSSPASAAPAISP
jgi:aspartate 1-decarboxylase